MDLAEWLLTQRVQSTLSVGAHVNDPRMVLRTAPGEPREYHLTEKGRGLKSVVITLNDWGDRWLRRGPIDYVRKGCGGVVKQTIACESCGNDVALDEIGVRRRNF